MCTTTATQAVDPRSSRPEEEEEEEEAAGQNWKRKWHLWQLDMMLLISKTNNPTRAVFGIVVAWGTFATPRLTNCPFAVRGNIKRTTDHHHFRP